MVAKLEEEDDDKEEEEEEDEDEDDAIGALLSSVSLHRSDVDEEEDEDTVGALLSSTSLNRQPSGEEGEEEIEANIDIQGNLISVSSLDLCESTSSFVSINTKEDDNDASAALTNDDGQGNGGEPSWLDVTTSRRKVRFDDDEQYQPPSLHAGNPTTPSPPPSRYP